MKNVNIPEGYPQITPYLVLPNAPAFIEFMQHVFDAEERYKVFRDEESNVIMHAELAVVTGVVMVADATDQFKQQNAGIYIYVDDCDSRYAQALKHGATTVMPPADQSYGRSAGILDPFGNTWWVTSV